MSYWWGGFERHVAVVDLEFFLWKEEEEGLDVVASRRTCPARIRSLLLFCISAHDTCLHYISCTARKLKRFFCFSFHAVRLHILTYMHSTHM